MKTLEKQSLEDLVTGNRDLVELEALISRFNIFEALGVQTRELHNSRFLGYLANPRENHGYGDIFLKRLIQAAVRGRPDSEVSCVDIDTGNLTLAEVYFERQNIDVFVYDESTQLAVVIENKINSKEHSRQLLRYHEFVKRQYPGCRFVGIYLTRDGTSASHEAYRSLSHKDIHGLVTELIERPGLHISEAIKIALKQYQELLGRHFMRDKETVELCRKIYRQHKNAIDLIIENKPDKRDFVLECVNSLIAQHPDLTADESTRAYIRFTSEAFSDPYLNGTAEWTESERYVLYEFRNEPKALTLIVQLGKGDQARRSAILQMAKKQGKPLSPESKLYMNWNRLYKLEILEESDYELDDETDESKDRRKVEKVSRNRFQVHRGSLPFALLASCNRRRISLISGGGWPTSDFALCGVPHVSLLRRRFAG